MRFWVSGPRFFGVRPGVSFGANDFKAKRSTGQSQQSKGEPIQGSFVYVIAGDHNMSKIGVTTNPTARIAQLRTGSAFPISYAFIGVTPSNGYDIEAKAHEILKRQRGPGEWFDVTPEAAMTAVMGAAAKLGQPLRPVDEAAAAKIIKMAANGGDVPEADAQPSSVPMAALAAFFIWIAALVEVRLGIDDHVLTWPNFFAFLLFYWLLRTVNRALA